MAFPPTVPPQRSDGTPVQTNHAGDHNTIANALTDIINKVSGSQVFVQAVYQAGPWAVGTTVTVNVPFKADITIVTTVSSWINVAGMGGVIIYWDGTQLAYWADMFFNVTGTHATTATTNVLRGVAAGNHTLSGAYVSANGASDANDRMHHALTMVQVP